MIAEEIAENLSTDMQKEGLCGRTLTLKLKTAAFEVRLILYHQITSFKWITLARHLGYRYFSFGTWLLI